MKIKLIKGLSYTCGIPGGGVVSVDAKKPFTEVSEEVAEFLISTGYFEACNDVPEEDADGESEGEDNSGGEAKGEDNGGDEGEGLPFAAFDADELADMTIAELRSFAKEKNIDLMGKTKKEDILNIISAAVYGGSLNMLDISE